MTTSLKDWIFNHIPPTMIAAVLCFWAFGPATVLSNSWTLSVMLLLTVLIVLVLERIHERHAGWRMNRQEFFTDLFYVALTGIVISWCTQAFAEQPLAALKASLGLTTEWARLLPWLAQVALVIFLVEFGQYWMHRLMHNWTPLWLTHAPHHHITQLNATKPAVGNPIELFLISLSVVALFDVEETAVLAAFNTLGVIGVFAHANVRSDPPRWYAFFFTTIQHHSLHHSTGYQSTRSNYANSFILLDRIFGTHRSGEAVIVGQGNRRRLSIREQMMFPFQPAINAYMARSEKISAERPTQQSRSNAAP